MGIVSLLFLGLLTSLSFSQEPIKVRLLEISVVEAGAYANKWEMPDNPIEGIKRNQIYITGLPADLATGDTWEGSLIREGAHTLKDGQKIPSYIVTQPREKKEVEKNDLNMSEAIFLVKTDQSQGSGFALEMKDGVYFITNLHVVDDGSQISIYTHAGVPVSIPNEYEIAENKDLFRFKIPNQTALRSSEGITIGEAVVAYGNSGGENIITELPGKILGIGPSGVEISCGIVHGNSGGPVLNQQRGVIGVATYMTSNTDDWARGTRFEGIRRFAIKINENEKWSKIPKKVFESEIKALSAMKEAMEKIKALALNFGNSQVLLRENLSKGLKERSQSQQKVDVAIDSYNRKDRELKQKTHLYFTQLAEASESLINDTRQFWESEYAKKQFEELSSRATEQAKAIRSERDRITRAYK